MMIEDLGKNEVCDKYVFISKNEKSLMCGTSLSVRVVPTEIDRRHFKN